MKQQQCEYETACREYHPTAFDKDGDCTSCVQGIMEHCDLRDLLPCSHAMAYLEEHEPYLGTTPQWYCTKCEEEDELQQRVAIAEELMRDLAQPWPQEEAENV